MKLKFQITHANGVVTFCKVSLSAFKIQTTDSVMKVVRECHPDAQVDYVGAV